MDDVIRKRRKTRERAQSSQKQLRVCSGSSGRTQYPSHCAYDRPVSPQRERDVASNIVASLPSGEASQSFNSCSDLGCRPFTPSKTSRRIWAWVFSAISFSLMVDYSSYRGTTSQLIACMSARRSRTINVRRDARAITPDRSSSVIFRLRVSIVSPRWSAMS
jgi:hypothetical protein